jgi:hypothetical protein
LLADQRQRPAEYVRVEQRLLLEPICHRQGSRKTGI